MENSFQTSFIPKKPITSSVSDRTPRSLFSLIATFLLIVSLVLSAGLFVYKIYLKKQKESLSVSLAVARDSFEKETIDELNLFDQRTQSVKQILGSHVVQSPMFALLGEVTIPSIQYTSFEQQTNDKGFLVSIEGLARDYKSIALQSEVLNSEKGRYFKNVLFSNLTKDKNNNIGFDLKFNVDPNLLSYEKNDLLERIKISNPDTPLNPLSQDLNNQPQ